MTQQRSIAIVLPTALDLFELDKNVLAQCQGHGYPRPDMIIISLLPKVSCQLSAVFTFWECGGRSGNLTCQTSDGPKGQQWRHRMWQVERSYSSHTCTNDRSRVLLKLTLLDHIVLSKEASGIHSPEGKRELVQKKRRAYILSSHQELFSDDDQRCRKKRNWLYVHCKGEGKGREANSRSESVVWDYSGEHGQTSIICSAKFCKR